MVTSQHVFLTKLMMQIWLKRSLFLSAIRTACPISKVYCLSKSCSQFQEAAKDACVLLSVDLYRQYRSKIYLICQCHYSSSIHTERLRVKGHVKDGSLYWYSYNLLTQKYCSIISIYLTETGDWWTKYWKNKLTWFDT